MSWSEKQMLHQLSENLSEEAFDAVASLRGWLVSHGAKYRRGVARTPSGRYGLPITDDYPTLIGFYTRDPHIGRNDRFSIGFMNLATRVDMGMVQDLKNDLMNHEAFAIKIGSVHPPFNRYPELDIEAVLNAPGALATLHSAIERLMRSY